MPTAGDSSRQETARQLSAAVAAAAPAYHRLVLLVGCNGSGKTELLQQLVRETGCPLVNVNLELSRRMLELPRKRRARQVERILKEFVDQADADPLVLDNLEILFDTALQVDPLRLLKSISRKRTIVASWNGAIGGDSLTYAEPDHPEYRSYRDLDVPTVAVGPQAAAKEIGSRQ